MSTVGTDEETAASLLASSDAVLARLTDELVALRDLEDVTARVSSTLQVIPGLEEDLARVAALLGERDDPPSVAAPVTVAAPVVRQADRFAARVTHLSLAAQDRAEAWAADLRTRPMSARFPERLRDAVRRARDVADGARTGYGRSVARGRALLDAGRRASRERTELLAARLQAHHWARAALRTGAVLAFGAMLAVQVLGVGRPSSVDGVVGAEVAAEVPAAPVPAAGPAPVVPAPADPIMPASTEPAARIAAPVALRVPAIDVDAPVVIVGLEPDGAMEIPADVRTVGWYEPFPGAGVVPGERGTAVIAGHVDSRTQGRGAFWPLRELRPGDVVEVLHEDGTASRWRVDEVVRYPKTDIPIEDIFTFDGDERLALITCGGEFDRSLGAYLDNYVVTASPLALPFGAGAQPLPASP